MAVSLQKAVGFLEGRMHGVENSLKDVKDAVGGLDAKLDEVIVQIAVARTRAEIKRKRYGRMTAIASSVITAAGAFLLKLKGGN